MQKRLTGTRRSNVTAAKKVRGAGGRDPERTSAAVLAAAVKEFAEKGYGGARIDSIARRAGANKRMIYHYFGGKEDLYLAVLESAYSDRNSPGFSRSVTCVMTPSEPSEPVSSLQKS